MYCKIPWNMRGLIMWHDKGDERDLFISLETGI